MTGRTIYIYIYIHIYIYIYIKIYVCMYVCMYVCVCVYLNSIYGCGSRKGDQHAFFVSMVHCAFKYSYLARWIGLVKTILLPYTFFCFWASSSELSMLKVRKNGQIGYFLHVHLQSTIKHNCVIIIYTQGTLFFFFFIRLYIYVGWTSEV